MQELVPAQVTRKHVMRPGPVALGHVVHTGRMDVSSVCHICLLFPLDLKCFAPCVPLSCGVIAPGHATEKNGYRNKVCTYLRVC
jgi:hypothetical protein